MVAHTVDPRTPEAEATGSEFKANLIYKVSTVRATQKNTVTKETNKNKGEKEKEGTRKKEKKRR